MRESRGRRNTRKDVEVIQELTSSEVLVNNALERALTEEHPDRSIEAMLAYLGENLSGERTYIFEQMEDGTFSNTYEWCREGIESRKESMQNLPYENMLEIWDREFERCNNILIPDLEEYREISRPIYDVLKPHGVHSLVVGPIRDGGRRIGFYGVDNPPVEHLEHISTMYSVLGKFITALLRHRRYTRLLEEYSLRDQMTGVSNRRALDVYFQLLDPEKPAGLIFCDVNGLKAVNDTMGHKAGDELIRNVTRAILEFFREDRVFRMGGDEFLVVVPDCSEQEVRGYVQELKEAFLETGVSVAIGSIWRPDATEGLDTLFTMVDREMYADKRRHYGDRRRNRA